MKRILITSLLLSFAPGLGAAVLTTLPTPVQMGGMVHVNVALLGAALDVHPEAGVPVLKPLSEWSPGDSFDSASPWYSTLDPSQSAGIFNSQWGLVLDGTVSDPLPLGSKILVNLISGPVGLEIYRWKNTAVQAFEPILGTSGSGVSWDWGSVSHGMTHPMFVMPAGSAGTWNVTLGFTLADSAGAPLADYTPAQATIPLTAVPEPSALVLSALGLALAARRSRPRA